ncbi:MAG: hypothetical protein ACKOCN_12640 [Planctomycetaceae bacterium]
MICLLGLVASLTGLGVLATPAEAARPRNPYSSFNLSGINYGAMQWERAQRQGKRVWPYYNVPGRDSANRPNSRGATGTRVIRSR